MMPGPWRNVEHIDYLTGSRGGEAWWLTLDCGHHVARPVRPMNFTLARRGKMAPHRCRCLLCHLQSTEQ
jgi:hypothetical protein